MIEQDDDKVLAEGMIVPFQTDNKGRRYLTGLQLVKDPRLQDLVDKHPQHFKHMGGRDAWYFIVNPVKQP